MSRHDEQMAEQTVLRVVLKMMFPFIIIYSVYVVTHGELGPGGGFQGGVIVAAAFILYGLIFGVDELKERVPPSITDSLMALGVLLYAGVGLVCLLKGGNFLDYSMLIPDDPSRGEALGMTLVEYGVGITVGAVMVTIYTNVSERFFLLSRQEATIDAREDQ